MSVPLVAMIAPVTPSELDNFYGQLLPAEGNYWMLMHRQNDAMVHESFDSIDTMRTRTEEIEANGVEVWHAVASFVHRHDEVKEGVAERWGRKRENVAYVGAFFLDIDVGLPTEGKPYGTAEIAKKALGHFNHSFGIPHNYVVHSGTGLHVYWFLDRDVPCDEWMRIAIMFKDATKVAGLFADPSRTADPTSVLRPVGTTNRKAKYGSTGRVVQGQWTRFGRVNVEAFEAACCRVRGDLVTTGAMVPVPTIAAGTTLAPLQAAHWFDDLSDDVKLVTLRTMLGALPAEDVINYSDWLAVGAALAGVKGLPRDILFNLFAEWSQSNDQAAASWREDTLTEQRRRWDGLTRSGVGSLILRARKSGWTTNALQTEPRGIVAMAAVIEAQNNSDEQWTLAEAQAYLRSHVIFVRADNQYLLDGLPVSKEALDTSLARHMPISERQISASGLFKKGAGFVVDHVGYRPGAGPIYIDHDARRIANTWRERFLEPISPSNEEKNIFARFLLHLFNGNEETKVGIKRIFTKLSFLFQNQSARIRHATLLIGKYEGCGKSTITLAIPRALFGSENVRSVETRELSSDFNGYAHGARVLVFPELWLGNRKDALAQANNLKPLITDDYIPVVKKGKDGRCIENCTTIFASSNHPDAAVFSERDRRYDVISTDARSLPSEIAKAIYSLIEKRPGALLSLVLAYGRDAGSFDPDAQPLHTAAKRIMLEAGRGLWAERIRDAFVAQEWPFRGDAVAVIDVKRLLQKDFDRLPSDNAIREELLSIVDGAYSVQAQRRRGAVMQQKRVIVYRNIDAWKDAGPSALYDHYYEMVVINQQS